MATNFLIKYPATVSGGATAWDAGREPKYIIVRGLDAKTANARKMALIVDLEWEGVTETKRIQFLTNVAQHANLTPFILYDPANYVLDGWSPVTARLINYTVTPRIGSSNVKAVFEEVI